MRQHKVVLALLHDLQEVLRIGNQPVEEVQFVSVLQEFENLQSLLSMMCGLAPNEWEAELVMIQRHVGRATAMIAVLHRWQSAETVPIPRRS